MRRHYITHPRFQAEFVISFLLGISLIVLVLGGSTVASLFLLAHDPLLNETQRLLLSDTAKEVMKQLLVVEAIALGFFGLISFYLSYKFVGPLYRLETWLDERLAQRDFTPLIIRPGDELSRVADSLNRIVEKIFRRPS